MNQLSVRIFLLQCFHKRIFGKILPYEIYRYLGQFLLPDYNNILLKGVDLGDKLNLSGRFPIISPWKSKSLKNNRLSHHVFNQDYNICIGWINISEVNTSSFLGIEFLKVKLNNYFLPIFAFKTGVIKSPFMILKEFSEIPTFVDFKKRIQHDNRPKLILQKMNFIFNNYYNFNMKIYQDKSVYIKSTGLIQSLIKDINHFLEIIFDSRNNFFKLRHIYYILPKLVRSFGDLNFINTHRIGQDINIINCSSIRISN